MAAFITLAGSVTNSAFESYEAFLITELKPHIDREYRTQPAAAHTAVMGSSVGGLCSVVLAWDHPEIFGGAASLSGTDIAEQTNFLNKVLKTFHGPPKPFRLYLDSGVVDSSGGCDGHSLTGQVAAEFRRIGWTGKNLELFTDAKLLTPKEMEKPVFAVTNGSKRKPTSTTNFTGGCGRGGRSHFFFRRRKNDSADLSCCPARRILPT